ncbi:hypothetical protein HPP92_021338 [Vanilla planifolia]|uniref:GBF-interacting protein 1 N-terminal domain-containing protein n=1 Tax=Vanilla planifolia TaxID=51239 RepID=A0A835PYY1_VANPL|nr:hypothetical protein HPP92_021338 [Vanilla planifolia]
MSGGSGGGIGRGNGAAAASGIPAGARRMVQTIKEIVNLPDQEIYVTLKECGMDPSEAVQRLLSQDSFHEVKSKRDKKKEMKEPPDSRSRTTKSTSNRGVRSGSDRSPRRSSILSTSNESRGKVVQKKEDVLSSSILGTSYSGRRATVGRETASNESLLPLTGIANGSSFQAQSPSSYQQGWTGIPGHVSMADIVKMGRPQGKLSGYSTNAGKNSSNVFHNQITSDATKLGPNSVNPVQPSVLNHESHSWPDDHQLAEDVAYIPGTPRTMQVSDDSWPSISQPNFGNDLAIADMSATATSYGDASKPLLVGDELQLHQAKVDEIPEIQQNAESESLQEGSPRSESLSEMENSLEISEVKTKLSLQKDGLVAPSLEDNPAVIIPRHLQVTNADCSHLSFGSFSSGISTTFPGSSSSNQLNCNLEVTDVADGFPSLHKSDARNSNYYDNGGLTSQINEDAVSRGAMSSMTYDMSTASVSEVIQDDAKNRTREISYNFPSLSGYGASSSTQQSAIAFAAPQASLQMQNLASLSTLMQSYTSSLQSSLLQPTLQPLRDLDLPFSPLLTTQSVSAKHSAETSISGPAISMSEVKPNAFPNLEPSQSSSGNNVPVGHSIPQQLPIHHYSQATLPLGPFANVISYPFLPPSYTYLPSAAFPQPYTSNGPFHQSLAVAPNAALKYSLPQYKSNISVSSLAQPPTIAAAYGNYVGSTTSGNTTLGLDEALSSQYKEGMHYLHLQQQNESSPCGVNGGSSRTVSPFPHNAFYGVQGQNQLNSFRQAQQQPSAYGPMGYHNLYQDQLGSQSHEHHQSPGEANHDGSHGNPSQSSHQMWQHGY